MVATKFGFFWNFFVSPPCNTTMPKSFSSVAVYDLIHEDQPGGRVRWPEIQSQKWEAGLFAGLPPELGGASFETGPEDFLAASLASCFGLTLQLMMKKRPFSLKFQAIQANISTILNERNLPKISEAHIQPHIWMKSASHNPSPEQMEELNRLLQAGLRYCLISQLIDASIPVSLEAPVFHPLDHFDHER
jgi:organic hydroperoxide reductase OsmC/OhrA